MYETLFKRRSEMLKQRSKGLPLNAVVNDLAQKYDRTKQALYKDWKNRKRWIKAVIDLGDPETAYLDIIARHEEIFQLGMLEYLKADNSNAKVGALRLLRVKP